MTSQLKSLVAGVAIGLGAMLGGQPPAFAQTEQFVDLELVLAVDVSLSMDIQEQRLQRDGYVKAFRDPQVLSAIVSGPNGRIAVTYVEWAGSGSQQTVVGWSLVGDKAAAEAFAGRLAAAPISRMRMTSISGALSYGSRMFAGNGVTGLRRVIDVSGDGPNNSGSDVSAMRDEVAAKGISINGLPVMLNRGHSGFFDISELDRYYENCVIGGPGAFMVPVRKAEEFADAIRRKLILEISDAMPQMPTFIPTAGALDTAGDAKAAGVDCQVGEKLWRQYMEGGFEDR